MSQSRWTSIGAILSGLAVALGAFAAHGLKTRFAELSTPDFQPKDVFDVGVRWHAIHALAILFVSIAPQRLIAARAATIACWTFFVGVVVFSGSLYLLATTGVRWLGAVTPIGGVSFLAGWTILAAAAARSRNDYSTS